jgi:hypothetical protein
VNAGDDGHSAGLRRCSRVCVVEGKVGAVSLLSVRYP